MTEIVDIVVLGNDEAVMLRHPMDDSAVDLSDDGTFIANSALEVFRFPCQSSNAQRVQPMIGSVVAAAAA
jgi:hypothetical protein